MPLDIRALKRDLNPEQYKAVTHEPGPLMVLAGAGAGKTRVITYRAMYMVQEYGIPPHRVLLITFTNKAAKEMDERLAQMSGGEHSPFVWTNTFHKWGLRILRHYLKYNPMLIDDLLTYAWNMRPEEFFDITNNNIFSQYVDALKNIYGEDFHFSSFQFGIHFNIADKDKMKNILKNIVSELIENKAITYVPPKNVNSKTAGLENFLEKTIEAMELEKGKGFIPGPQNRNREITIDQIAFNNAVNNYLRTKSLRWLLRGITPYGIYRLLYGYMYHNNMLSIGDLLYFPYIMLHIDAYREEIEQFYDAIFVDEFQDVNKMQYEIIRLLGQKHKNITIVGDQQQCIYTWRGSAPIYVSQFKSDFKPDVIHLTKNYRSAGNIVKLANGVGKYLTVPHKVTMENIKEEDEDAIIILNNISNKTEAAVIAEEIVNLIKQGYDYRDIAILYRMNRQADLLDIELLKRNIPHVIIKGRGILDTAMARDLIAFLTALIQPNDTKAVKRVLLGPTKKGMLKIDGIGDKTINKITSILHRSAKAKTIFPPISYFHAWKQVLRENRVTKSHQKLSSLLYVLGLFSSIVYASERVIYQSKIEEEMQEIEQHLAPNKELLQNPLIDDLPTLVWQYITDTLHDPQLLKSAHRLGLSNMDLEKVEQHIYALFDIIRKEWLNSKDRYVASFPILLARDLIYILKRPPHLVNKLTPRDYKLYQLMKQELKLEQFISPKWAEGLFTYQQDNKTQRSDRAEEFYTVVQLITNAGSIHSFIENTVLGNEQDSVEEDDNRVKLMTIHTAKGLEFPVVFLIGVADGILPARRGITGEILSILLPEEDVKKLDETERGMLLGEEEEKRLFYVAITRAKEKLYISEISMVTHYGKWHPLMPSPFMEYVRNASVSYKERNLIDTKSRLKTSHL